MAHVKEAHSAGWGRHLVLSQEVQAGTTVLAQQPYAAALYDDQVMSRCDYCFRACESLMRCSRSKFAHYCSIAHQKTAWRAYYKQECGALVACAPNIPPASVRLAARVLWRRARWVPDYLLHCFLLLFPIMICTTNASCHIWTRIYQAAMPGRG